LGRRRHQDALDRHLRAWAAEQTAEPAAATLRDAGVPASAAVTIAELIEDPQLLRRGAFAVIDHPAVGPRLYTGQPVRGATLGLRFDPAPLLGADGAAICRELMGLSAPDVAALEASGALEAPVVA